MTCKHRCAGFCRLYVYTGCHSPAKCNGCPKAEPGRSDCPAEPATSSTAVRRSSRPAGTGAGNQLCKLLARGGISACSSCNARANEMNRHGVQWCKDNVDLIVGWLRSEAAARKLPFVEFAARLLIRRAIRLAVKAEQAGQASKVVQTAVEGR